MREEILEAVTVLENRYVRKWKSGGGKIIGYPCSYMPVEIIAAAGMLPFRLRAMEVVSTSIGNSYYGPVVCSFPKCILQIAGERKYAFLDGAVVCNGCDTMRRLDDCWRKADDDMPGILPPYFVHFAIPHKVTDYGTKWFAGEIRKFIDSLERHFDVKISDDGLKKAVREYNRSRALLGELDALRSGPDVFLSGTDAMSLLIAGTAMPAADFNALLEDVLGGLKKKKKKDALSGRRLLLAGSVIDDIDLFKTIEEAGALIVADTVCFGSRDRSDPVREDSDPVAALAERYLGSVQCPRMFGDYKRRFTHLKELAQRTAAEGVILQNIRFCDLHGSENGIFERDLEAAGVPCLRMEREYGPLGDEGRVRMRIDALLERIGAGGGGSRRALSTGRDR
jgi:benzoyl-CoA reductase/2-hydroxyglutaryl-CoA dehydratase subunit BcrC/BadD/HgdB